MFSKTMNCKTCLADLPNLLLDPAAPENTAARAHIAVCSDCARELAALESTMALLDSWEVPEVSPYFDQKLAVRLREEQAAPAPGWFEQLKTRLLLNTGRQFRPALAGVMALLLIAGGLLSFLPVLGLWMLPLGLLLLAEDVPPLRRASDRVLDRVERRWPHWFSASPSARHIARKESR